MPIGSSSVFARCAAILERQKPKSVLDLGIGMGANAVIVRQWLDYGVQPWKTRLVGVEGWAKYENPAWGLYDFVEVGRIEDSPTLADRWDCVLMTDVLEHFDKAAGRHMLYRIAGAVAVGGFALVSTPAVFWAQEACHGNELERHRCVWTPDDFRADGWDVLWDGSPDQHGQRMLLASWGLGA